MSSTPNNKTFDTKDNLKVPLSDSCEYLCTKRMNKRHDAFFCWKDLITGCWFTAGMKHHPDPAWMKVPFGEWKINALADRLRRTACDVLALFLFLRLSSNIFFSFVAFIFVLFDLSLYAQFYFFLLLLWCFFLLSRKAAVMIDKTRIEIMKTSWNQSDRATKAEAIKENKFRWRGIFQVLCSN